MSDLTLDGVWLGAFAAVIEEHELSMSDKRPNATVIPIPVEALVRGQISLAKAHEGRRNAERHLIRYGTFLSWISGVGSLYAIYVNKVRTAVLVHLLSGKYPRGLPDAVRSARTNSSDFRATRTVWENVSCRYWRASLQALKKIRTYLSLIIAVV